LDIIPGAIVFELLESVFLDGEDKIIDENLAMMAAMGIDVEIDDFGTGHASIISLLRIAPKRLKIDRALVQPIVTSPQRRALLETIMRIGQMLDIAVVAEGVESDAHISILQELNCDYLQGYALARPMDAAAIQELMAAQQSAPCKPSDLPCHR
jgi:EAL domain-containing protein (putative c-di-GMP-specific phosphodiesterase class I)